MKKSKCIRCINCWFKVKEEDKEICKMCKNGDMWRHYETRESLNSRRR